MSSIDNSTPPSKPDFPPLLASICFDDLGQDISDILFQVALVHPVEDEYQNDIEEKFKTANNYDSKTSYDKTKFDDVHDMMQGGLRKHEKMRFNQRLVDRYEEIDPARFEKSQESVIYNVRAPIYKVMDRAAVKASFLEIPKSDMTTR